MLMPKKAEKAISKFLTISHGYDRRGINAKEVEKILKREAIILAQN